MARMGKVDFSELKALVERVEKLGDGMDTVFREVSQEQAAVLMRKARNRTPVGVKPRLAAKDENDRKALGGVDTKRTYKVKGASGKSRSFLTREGAILAQYWNGYTGGNLRKSWHVSNTKKAANVYSTDVYNDAKRKKAGQITEYASYVEYGHRQRPGRYVPALGKQLKVSFVPGKYMLRLSVNEVKKALPKALERSVEKKLKEVFGGG